MSQVTKTITEDRWGRGKRFLHLFSLENIPAGDSASVVICTDDNPVVVEKMDIKANVEVLSWQGFVDTEFASGTGSKSNGIPRNSAAKEEESATVTTNPTVTSQGNAFSLPINLVAQVFRNNFYYLTDVILDGDFYLEPNTCYMVDFKNTSDAETTIEMALSISNL